MAGVLFAGGRFRFGSKSPETPTPNIRFIQEMIPDNNTRPPLKVRLYHGVPLVEMVRRDGLLRENGLEIDYDFKCPKVQMAWRMTNTITHAKKTAQRIKTWLTQVSDQGARI